MQAKKSCPFIHLASASSLRRLTTSGSSPLVTKAKQCPIMSQAISTRALSTTPAVKQTPSQPIQAAIQAEVKASNGIIKSLCVCEKILKFHMFYSCTRCFSQHSKTF